MKGSEIIKSIKRYDVDSKLEFHFLGNCHDGIDEIGINHGTFERDDFFLRVKEIKPSFIGIFSIWPETFCHTLTEAWNCGIPVLGSNLGVIQDRILKEKGGWILNIDSPKCMYDKILEIAQQADIKPVKEIAKKLNINEDDLEFYGKYKAKVDPLSVKGEEKLSEFDNKLNDLDAGKSSISKKVEDINSVADFIKRLFIIQHYSKFFKQIFIYNI